MLNKILRLFNHIVLMVFLPMENNEQRLAVTFNIYLKYF
jgi:hypothetical protein